MCQSCGRSAISAAKTSASAWVAPVTRSRSRPPAASGISGWIRTAHPSGVNHIPTGSSAAPVVAASSAGPAGIRAVSPKNRTSTPRLVRSRSPSRHTTPPARSRSASTSDGVRSPPVSGTTSMPRPSRYSRKRR